MFKLCKNIEKRCKNHPRFTKLFIANIFCMIMSIIMSMKLIKSNFPNLSYFLTLIFTILLFILSITCLYILMLNNRIRHKYLVAGVEFIAYLILGYGISYSINPLSLELRQKFSKFPMLSIISLLSITILKLLEYCIKYIRDNYSLEFNNYDNNFNKIADIKINRLVDIGKSLIYGNFLSICIIEIIFAPTGIWFLFLVALFNSIIIFISQYVSDVYVYYIYNKSIDHNIIQNAFKHFFTY